MFAITPMLLMAADNIGCGMWMWDVDVECLCYKMFTTKKMTWKKQNKRSLNCANNLLILRNLSSLMRLFFFRTLVPYLVDGKSGNNGAFFLLRTLDRLLFLESFDRFDLLDLEEDFDSKLAMLSRAVSIVCKWEPVFCVLQWLLE